MEQRQYWEQWHQSGLRKRSEEGPPSELAYHLANIVGTLSHRRILDLGCGQGDDTAFFIKRGARAVGMDFSRVALRGARQIQHTAPPPALVLADMAYSLPFRDSSFDVVYSHLSLHYFDTKATRYVIQEIDRVLSGRGYFLASVKSTNDDRYGVGTRIAEDMFDYHGHIRHFFSPATLTELLSGLFRIEEMHERKGVYDESPGAFLEFVARQVHA